MNARSNYSWKRDCGRTYAALVASVLLAGTGGWLAWRHGHRSAPGGPPVQVYTAQGYGGFVSAPPARPPAAAAYSPAAVPTATALVDPDQPLRDGYNAGRYREVEAAAAKVILAAPSAPTVARRRQSVEARQVLAYVAARRHDLKLARARFAALQTEAARLPDRGRQPALGGDVQPTLEAEGAFQQAVCTGALGDSTSAEAQYQAFMTRYPDSPLVAAAMTRIARMHGGNVPPAAQAVWRQARRVAGQRKEAAARDEALCGPECLAEWLRRQGQAANVGRLARELGTSGDGTSLLALAGAATRRGFAATGMALTQKGLAAQRLPLIALVTPGHYVLVEAVGAAQVTIWDPDAHGLGRSDQRTLALPEWARMWRGLALVLRPAALLPQTAAAVAQVTASPPHAPLRTARR